MRLLELSALAPRGLELREAAFRYLEDLHQTTKGNVQLGVRDGLRVVYVEAIRARARNPVSSRVGDRWPMHATGTGLVLLAHAEPELQEQVLRSPLERFNALTVIDPEELRRRLARVRQTGVAIALGQITMPDLVVAVPVYGPGHQVVAAISVVVEAAGARPQELAALLSATSRKISAALEPGPRTPDGVRPEHARVIN